MSILLKPLAALFLYGTIILSGYFFATQIGVKRELEKIGVGILVATYSITFFAFLLYSYFAVRYTLINLIILILVVLSITSIPFFLSLKKNNIKFKINLDLLSNQLKSLIPKYDVLFLIFLVSIPVTFTCIQNIHWPVVDWDAVALYDYRAKVFSISGGMEDGISRGYFLHYPLYTSLLHTFSYLFNLETVRTWYSIIYIATLFIFYELLKRNVSTKRALIGVFLLAISPRIFQHSQMTYTNFPHAVYLSLGYIYLCEWFKKGEKLDIFIGGLLVAGSMWIRLTEPLWLPTLLIILVGIWKRKSQWKISLFTILLILFLRQPWTSFVKLHDQLDISNPLQIGVGLQLPTNPNDYLIRFKEVSYFFFSSVYPLFSQYVPSLVIASLYALYKEKWHEVFEYLNFLLLVLFIFSGIFLFSFQFNGWKDIPDSAARMSMFLLPLSVYLIMKSDLWSIPIKKTK